MTSGNQKSIMLAINPNQQVSVASRLHSTVQSMFLIQLLSFSSMQDDFSMYSKANAGSQLHANNKQQQPQHHPPTSVQYVIQGGKMSNMFVSNVKHHYEPSMPPHGAMMSGGAMRIKEEPESPTIRNLPATPKSNEPPSNQQSEGSEGNEQHEDDDDESPDSKQFVLAPTPAQLGKAPLQRRLNRGDFEFISDNHAYFIMKHAFAANSSSSSSMPDTPTMETITTSVANTMINPPVPSALPTPTSANFDDFQSQISPSVKSKMYKKIKTDDMDK